MCIREVDRIGVSKKAARKQGMKFIHSKKVKNEVRKISMQFANYVRDNFDIKKLHNVTQEHYKAFLASKSHTTLDYRRGIETHLNLLQKGLQRRSERFGKEQVQFVPEKRLIPSRGRLEGVSDRSIKNASVIERLKENVSRNVSNSIDLMHRMGFRVDGVVSIKVKDVDFEKGVVGVTEKGGRHREVPIPKGFEKKLAGMIEGKETHERLVPIKKGTVSDAIKEASRKINMQDYTGTHAFRHTYCRDRVDEIMTKGEKELLQRCLSQYAAGKNFNYGVHDQELYNSMKTKIDQIHAEVGHGKNRFDLALRYMR